MPAALAQRVAQSKPIYPSPDVLAISQNRINEKQLFDKLGILNPKYHVVKELKDLKAAASNFGFPLVIKTATMRYVGKGLIVVEPGEFLVREDGE